MIFRFRSRHTREVRWPGIFYIALDGSFGGSGGNIVRHSSTVSFLNLPRQAESSSTVPPLYPQADSSLRTPKILPLLRSMMPFNGMLTPYCLWSNNKRYSVLELSLTTHVVVPCGTLRYIDEQQIPEEHCDTLTSSRSPIYNCMIEVVLDEEPVLLLSGQGCDSSNTADVIIDMEGGLSHRSEPCQKDYKGRS